MIFWYLQRKLDESDESCHHKSKFWRFISRSSWRICGQATAATLPSNFFGKKHTLSSWLLTAKCVTCRQRVSSPQGFHGFRKDWHRLTHFPCLIFSRTTPRHLVSSKCSKTHFKAMFFRNHVANVARFKVLKMLNCVPGKLFDVYVLVGSLSQMPKPSKGNRSYKWEAWLTMFKGQFICGYSCLWMDRHLELFNASNFIQGSRLKTPFWFGVTGATIPTLNKHDWCNWYLFLPLI